MARVEVHTTVYKHPKMLIKTGDALYDTKHGLLVIASHASGPESDVFEGTCISCECVNEYSVPGEHCKWEKAHFEKVHCKLPADIEIP